jgi:hypothetical protein
LKRIHYLLLEIARGDETLAAWDYHYKYAFVLTESFPFGDWSSGRETSLHLPLPLLSWSGAAVFEVSAVVGG